MTERVSLINSNKTQLNNDYDFTALPLYLLGNKGWVVHTDNNPSAFSFTDGVIGIEGKTSTAYVLCTRATTSPIPNQKFLVKFECFGTKSLPAVTGNKVYIEIDNSLVNDPTLIKDEAGSTSFALWLNIWEIKSTPTYPSHTNYLPLYEISGSWEIIDKREAVALNADAVAQSQPIKDLQEWQEQLEQTIEQIETEGLPTASLTEDHYPVELIIPGQNIGFPQLSPTSENCTEEYRVGDIADNQDLYITRYLTGEDFNSIEVKVKKVWLPTTTLNFAITDYDTGVVIDNNATGSLAYADITTAWQTLTVNLNGNVQNNLKGRKVKIHITQGLVNTSNYYVIALDATQYGEAYGFAQQKFYYPDINIRQTAIPNMTANVMDGYTVIYSSSRANNNYPYAVFNTTTNYWSSELATGTDEWIGILLPTPKKFQRIGIEINTFAQWWKGFTLQGSQNGTDWVDVYRNDVQTVDNVIHYYSFENDTEYLYYRVYFSLADRLSTNYVYVRKIEFAEEKNDVRFARDMDLQPYCQSVGFFDSLVVKATTEKKGKKLKIWNKLLYPMGAIELSKLGSFISFGRIPKHFNGYFGLHLDTIDRFENCPICIGNNNRFGDEEGVKIVPSDKKHYEDPSTGTVAYGGSFTTIFTWTSDIRWSISINAMLWGNNSYSKDFQFLVNNVVRYSNSYGNPEKLLQSSNVTIEVGDVVKVNLKSSAYTSANAQYWPIRIWASAKLFVWTLKQFLAGIDL